MTERTAADVVAEATNGFDRSPTEVAAIVRDELDVADPDELAKVLVDELGLDNDEAVEAVELLDPVDPAAKPKRRRAPKPKPE